MIALLAAVAWGGPIASTPDAARVERVLAGLRLEDKVGQMILAYPQLDAVAPVTVGGVLFVGKTLADPEAARARIAASVARSAIPPFMAVDLEGGGINRMKSVPALADVPSAVAMSRLTDAEVEAWGFRVGSEMRKVGLNVDLAPVLDVAASGRLFDSERSFGGDPAVVAAKGRAFSQGLHRAGVVAVGKHYPGYGDVALDTDSHSVSVSWPKDRVDAGAAVFHGVRELDGVMLSNVAYSVYGDRPAILTSQLVAAAGTHGWLTVTDDLAIPSLAESIGGTTADVVRAAFLAGNDLLLTTAPPDWTEGIDYRAVILELVRSDPTLERRVDASVRRILGLKDRMGLLDGR